MSLEGGLYSGHRVPTMSLEGGLYPGRRVLTMSLEGGLYPGRRALTMSLKSCFSTTLNGKLHPNTNSAIFPSSCSLVTEAVLTTWSVRFACRFFGGAVGPSGAVSVSTRIGHSSVLPLLGCTFPDTLHSSFSFVLTCCSVHQDKSCTEQ